MFSEISILLTEISWARGGMEKVKKILALKKMASSRATTLHIIIYPEYFLNFFFSDTRNIGRICNTMLLWLCISNFSGKFFVFFFFFPVGGGAQGEAERES